MNFAELAAASAAQRQALDDRVTGKSPAPAVDIETPEGEASPVVDPAEAAKAFAHLTAEEAEAVIARAEQGDDVALGMLEALTLEAPTPVQAGDGGGGRSRGATDTPGAVFNRAVRTALNIGLRRQAERRGKSMIELGGRVTQL
jgi:hypothetical protein